MQANIKLEQPAPPPWDFKMLNFIRKQTCPNSATQAARIILLSWLSNRAEDLVSVEHSYKKGKQLINYVFPESDSTLCSQRHFPAMFLGTANNHGFAENCREDLSDQADTTTLKKQVNWSKKQIQSMLQMGLPLLLGHAREWQKERGAQTKPFRAGEAARLRLPQMTAVLRTTDSL